MKRISLIKTLHENVKNIDMAKNSHYVFIRNGELVNQLNDICYARLQKGYNDKNKITSLRIFINQHKRKTVNALSWKRWMKWVTKESMWKSAFINTRNWEKDGISINCSLPLDFVGAAITVLREGYEFPVCTDAWCKLVDNGITPALAHVFCDLMRDKANKNADNEYLPGNKGHHGALSYRMEKEEIVRYLKGEPYKTNRKPMNVACGSFQGVWKLFSRSEGYDVNGFVHSFCKKYYVKKGEGWKATTTLVVNEKFYSDVLSLQKELLNA